MDGRSSPAPARSSSTPPQWRARAGQLRSARWSASVFSAISHSGRCAACGSKPSLASAQRQSSAQTFVDGISRLCIMSVVRFIVTGSVSICIRIQELLRIQTDVRVIRTRHTNIAQRLPAHALDSRRTWCLSKVAVELSNLLSLYCRILSYTVVYCRTVILLILSNCRNTVEHCRTLLSNCRTGALVAPDGF